MKGNKFLETTSVFAKKLPWLALVKKCAELRKFMGGTKPHYKPVKNKPQNILKIKANTAVVQKKKKKKVQKYKRQWWNLHQAIDEMHSRSSEEQTLCVTHIYILQTYLQYE